jgi:hypothetical protein
MFIPNIRSHMNNINIAVIKSDQLDIICKGLVLLFIFI